MAPSQLSGLEPRSVAVPARVESFPYRDHESKEGIHLQPAQLALPPTFDLELLRQLTFGRPWFHQIDLGHGIITPGIDDSKAKLNHLRFPSDLTGKSVLDIGAFDGFFSFEAESRGALRVVASDKFCWTIPDSMADGRGFQIAHWARQSRVVRKEISVEDISPGTVGMFDLVLLLGVLYHSQDPLGYLRRAYSVCEETCIIETHIDGQDYERPAMVFYPEDTLSGDPSNYWGPNEPCVVAMLREVGFTEVEKVGIYNSNRLVVHAHR